MIRANQNRVLQQLTHHAATMNYLLNTQDAILIIKALQSLQVRTNDVKRICEKASISIAARPSETNATVIVDTVNALASLQASNMKVVHNVLVKRFLELGSSERGSGTDKETSTVKATEAKSNLCTGSAIHPKTVQKASFALLKLGRKNVQVDVAEHVFRLLVSSLRETPQDAGLHLALISIFCLLSRKWYALDAEERSALFDACTFLFESGVSSTGKMGKPCLAASLKGNMAWQAMHFYVVYAQVALCDVIPPTKPDELDGFFVEDQEDDLVNGSEDSFVNDVVAQQRAVWLASFHSFLRRRPLHVESMSAGSYAQFLSDNLQALWLHSPTRRESLSPLQDSAFFARFNTYDVAKVSMALCHALERHPGVTDESLETPTSETPLVKAAESGGAGADLQVLHVVFNCVVRIDRMLQQDAASAKRANARTERSFLVQRHGTALGSTWQLFQVAGLVAFTAEEEAGEGAPGWREKMDKILKRLCRTTTAFLSCTEPDATLISWLFNSVAKVSRTGAYTAELDELIHHLFEKHMKLPGTGADAAPKTEYHLFTEHVKNLLSYTYLCTLSPLELYLLRNYLADSSTSLATKRTTKYQLNSSMAATLFGHVSNGLEQGRMDGEKNMRMLADTLCIYLKELNGGGSNGSHVEGDGTPFRRKVAQLALSFLELASERANKSSTSTLLSLVQCGLALLNVSPHLAFQDEHTLERVPAQLLEWLQLPQAYDINFLQWSLLLFRLDTAASTSSTFSNSKSVNRYTVELYRCVVRGLCETSAAVNYTDPQRSDYIAPHQWLHAAEVARRRGATLYMDIQSHFLAAREGRTEKGNASDLFFLDVDAFVKRDLIADDAVSAHLLRLIGEDYKAKGVLPTKRMHVHSLVRWCLYGREEKDLSPRLCSPQCLVYLLNASTFLVHNEFLSVEQVPQILECLYTHLNGALSSFTETPDRNDSPLERKAVVQLISSLCEAEPFWQHAKQKCEKELVRSVKKAALNVGIAMAESPHLEEQMCALKVNLL